MCEQSSKKRKGYDEERKKRSDALAEDEIQAVKDLYVRDDVSRMLPGKKHFLSVKCANGKREHRQNRLHLLKATQCCSHNTI